MSRQGEIIETKDAKPRRFVFVLMNEFTMMCFASAVEALRIANRMADKNLYEWRVVSVDGQPVISSAGVVFKVDAGLEDLCRDDSVMLCGGLNIRAASSPKLVNWIRKESRRGSSVTGLCTAAYTMAKAGLLDGKRATIHWEHHDGLVEDFPDIAVLNSVFVVDGKMITTAGGTSSIDLMLKFIADGHGEHLANAVADQLIYTSIRTEKDSPRLSIPSRIGVRHLKLSNVIQTMELNLEDPISPAVLAKDVGMSTRQLERLFQRYLNRSPKRFYMEIRLQKARNLLMQTDMSVINVALASGFSSPSHFSKCYRAQYATTPYRERGVKAELPAT
ncbi:MULTISPECIES: GlxA family transcriptional regulator [Falsihalocynthiibacter]|uniref:AraC family transcriptional regulator n=1 Tax=Falsihalocynthiibacter arcticus TaxID=1579316 RepID=A0A126V5Z5_9RHOB|nr:GlxA family transcriptional regulator [Falsihalocynthiibacter arcticus]AML53713.1 AraC family transcriptional regulator [Falsihalocynthiibacter arcticus]